MKVSGHHRHRGHDLMTVIRRNGTPRMRARVRQEMASSNDPTILLPLNQLREMMNRPTPRPPLPSRSLWDQVADVLDDPEWHEAAQRSAKTLLWWGFTVFALLLFLKALILTWSL